MNDRLIRWLRCAADLYEPFRPKFYNRLTWFLVASGLAIASTTLVEQVTSSFLDVTFDIRVTDGWDALVGLSIIIVGLVYHALLTSLTQLSEADSASRLLADRRQHDLRVFARTNEVLDEVQYFKILDWIGTDHSCLPDQADKLDQYFFVFELTENTYLIEDLERSKKEMHSSLQKLRGYMATRFFIHRDKSCLDPDKNMDRASTAITVTDDDAAIYSQQASELIGRIQAARASFASYRRTVQRHLFV